MPDKETMMRIRVQMIIETDQETTPLHVEEVACFERGTLTPETPGLRLDEAKQVLAGVQQVMTAQQVENYKESPNTSYTKQVRSILRRKAPFVALVDEEKRFRSLIDRQGLLERTVANQ